MAKIFDNFSLFFSNIRIKYSHIQPFFIAAESEFSIFDAQGPSYKI